MSQPGVVHGDMGLPLWVITGSDRWSSADEVGNSCQAGEEIKSPFGVDCLPAEQVAIALDTPEEETIDLGEAATTDQTSGTPDLPQDTSPQSDPELRDHCRDHGEELSWFCYQDHRLICPQCRTVGSCQTHKTKPVEERAVQIRNKIVDQCEKQQLQTAGIEKYLADVLPAKILCVASTARATRELIIQRLIFIRTVCENEEQRLLEEVHAEEERAQQGILTQRAHWTECDRKLSGIRTCLVDMLTKLDDLSIINSENEIYERTEKAEGILEPKESEKLNFNVNCAHSPLLNSLWASSILCCTTGFEDITVDEKTINPLLVLSEDKKLLTFHQKKAKDYTDGPERFNHWPNCMSNKSFQSGIHAWKINVEKSCAYKLGVAYGSMARKGSSNDARLGYNPVSWVFSRYDKDFRFSHDSQNYTVELIKCPKHIGVLVDLEGGELIFYDPGTCTILYTHHTKFTAPVLPVFAVADECINIVQ
ncbi:B box and SPRY domain-containing protein [Ascaphus truei]|uniref:B box and SPRY domain-containing protein n=1 Tax=Ascaphus truei TaxID=8439 RepID=UPI003F5964C6